MRIFVWVTVLFVYSELVMLSLHRDQSRNFFSCRELNFSEVKYWECRLHAAKCVIARPWRLDDRPGISGKDRHNCLWSLESSRVVGGLSPSPSDVAITGICLRCHHVNFSSTVELFTRPVHCLIQSYRCGGADLVSLYCIWRWPHLCLF